MTDMNQLDSLLGNSSNITDSITSLVIITVITTLIFVPILLYLKYKMDIKIVRKGTLQALQEFYNKEPSTKDSFVNKESTITESTNNNQPNINRDEIL